MRRRVSSVILGLLLAPLQAAETLGSLVLCPAPDPMTASTAPPPDGKSRILADRVYGDASGTLTFEGHVELHSEARWLSADSVTVTDTPRTVIARDNIRANSNGFQISGERMKLDETTQRAEFSNVDYTFPPRGLYGKAESVEQLGNVVTLARSSYTTCAGGHPDWQIVARDIRLDRDNDIGTVRGATLQLGKVPVVYLPWASFPISDKRKSGLLYPNMGTSDTGGFELSVPYYWNIAPNYDATIAPRFIQQRGLMWENEIRYLDRHSRGTLDAHYLHDDDRAGKDRHLLRLQSSSHWDERWSFNADASQVSDAGYLDDFTSDLNLTSLSHLSQRADIDYYGQHFHFRGRAQDYQTVNDTIAPENHPYRQLPQLTLDATLPTSYFGTTLSMGTEVVRFEHDLKQTGSRADINPRISWGTRSPAGYVNPALSWRYTQYELDKGSNDGERSLTRESGTLSVDSGLNFERATASGNTQTLEPRLYYLRTPYRDQRDIPIFDTSESAFSFYSLFRENRYNGRDRIGDANQLTAAVTTRLLDQEDGEFPWKASLGQIFYFDDRNVTLPDGAPQTNNRSAYAGELSFDPSGPWENSASLLADPDLEKTQALTFLSRYRGTNGRILNLEYRFRENDIEQSNLSFSWPVHRRWRVMGRWLHSLEDRRDVEVIGGIEYDNCCWSLQLVGRRYAADAFEEYTYSYYLQLILKGLSSQGSAASLLSRSITGYQIENE